MLQGHGYHQQTAHPIKKPLRFGSLGRHHCIAAAIWTAPIPRLRKAKVGWKHCKVEFEAIFDFSKNVPTLLKTLSRIQTRRGETPRPHTTYQNDSWLTRSKALERSRLMIHYGLSISRDVEGLGHGPLVWSPLSFEVSMSMATFWTKFFRHVAGTSPESSMWLNNCRKPLRVLPGIRLHCLIDRGVNHPAKKVRQTIIAKFAVCIWPSNWFL